MNFNVCYIDWYVSVCFYWKTYVAKLMFFKVCEKDKSGVAVIG